MKNHLLLGISSSTAPTITINAYSGKGGYYLISVPFEEVNPEAVEHMLDNNYDLYKFDESQDREWINYKAGSYNLEAGKGYLYANSNNVTLSFTGTPYSGNGEITLAYTPNADFAGFNLIGNPYASEATLDKPYYRLNNVGSALKAETENTAIAMMEGVFVQASAANQTATFTAQTSKAGKQDIAYTDIMVSDNKGNVLDNAILRFDNGLTLDKFYFGEQDANIYIHQDGKEYAIAHSDGQGEIPVNFKVAENGTYSLSVHTEALEMDYLHLIDNLTGNDVDLLQTPSYTFEAKTTDYESRFKLLFNANGEDDLSTGSDIFAFINNGEIIINGEGTLQVIDILGRQLFSREVNSVFQIPNSEFTPGVYVLRLFNGDDVKTQKMIIGNL